MKSSFPNVRRLLLIKTALSSVCVPFWETYIPIVNKCVSIVSMQQTGLTSACDFRFCLGVNIAIKRSILDFLTSLIISSNGGSGLGSAHSALAECWGR